MEHETNPHLCYGCQKEKIGQVERFDGVYLCEQCYDSLDDKTGYCSIDCCLGFGCDGSC